MWLSKKMAASAAEELLLADGIVTVGGEAPAVKTDGEERAVAIAAPGGYFWRPAPRDRVLVSRSGGTTVLGRLQPAAALLPGEVRISTGKASISLRPDGKILLEGEIYLNGKKWESVTL